MGELIRQHATGQARADMLAGKIISDSVTFEIIEKALEPINTAKEEFIVEGNPRSVPQAKWWTDKVKRGKIKMTGIIHLVVDPPIAKQRLTKRGRLDDHDGEVIDKRIEEYHRSIKPTLDYLKASGMPVHEIDASPSLEEVFLSIRKALDLR